MSTDRNLFQYFNGDAQVWGDPLRIQRRLYQVLGNPDDCLRDCKAADQPLALKATDCLIEAARQAFDMVPFDPATGQGATEEDCRQALEALWECLAKKNATAASLPTSSPPTAVCPAA